MDEYAVIFTKLDTVGIFSYVVPADTFEQAEGRCEIVFPNLKDILWVAKCTDIDYSDEGKWVG